MHVIGSCSTYGDEPESTLIPTALSYADEILSYISEEDISNGSVIFHGNLGEEKFDIIRQCNFAILNPTGKTEAFPASPLECMSFGLPVIASDDYGMSDAMRFFPELVIKKPSEILERIEWLVADEMRYKEMQQRSIAVAKWFDSQFDQINTRWVRLIEAVFDGNYKNLCLFLQCLFIKYPKEAGDSARCSASTFSS